jgi:hypothetical protein
MPISTYNILARDFMVFLLAAGYISRTWDLSHLSWVDAHPGLSTVLTLHNLYLPAIVWKEKQKMHGSMRVLPCMDERRFPDITDVGYRDIMVRHPFVFSRTPDDFIRKLEF